LGATNKKQHKKRALIFMGGPAYLINSENKYCNAK
jgi:hypothetical protein